MKVFEIDRDDSFIFYQTKHPIKSYATTSGYYINITTGENCGQYVEIYEGDEDHYELVDFGQDDQEVENEQ